MNDKEIYKSDEYKARIERAQRSLSSFHSSLEAIKTAAESIAYWQMRTVHAEHKLYENNLIEFEDISKRIEI